MTFGRVLRPALLACLGVWRRANVGPVTMLAANVTVLFGWLVWKTSELASAVHDKFGYKWSVENDDDCRCLSQSSGAVDGDALRAGLQFGFQLFRRSSGRHSVYNATASLLGSGHLYMRCVYERPSNVRLVMRLAASSLGVLTMIMLDPVRILTIRSRP